MVLWANLNWVGWGDQPGLDPRGLSLLISLETQWESSGCILTLHVPYGADQEPLGPLIQHKHQQGTWAADSSRLGVQARQMLPANHPSSTQPLLGLSFSKFLLLREALEIHPI